MTPLDKTLKRSLSVKGIEYVVTLSPEALKLTRKGRRLGMELKWADITSGESALAVALHASVGRFDAGKEEKGAKTETSTKTEKNTKNERRPKDTAAAARPGPARTRRSARGSSRKAVK